MRSVFSLTALMIFVMTGCSNDTADSTAQVESDASHYMHSSADGHGQEAAHSDATAHYHAHESFKLTGENTQVLFTGTKKSGDNHSGGFKAISGEITLAENAAEAIKVVIQTDSLFSDADRLTGHLKNEDFFSVQEFPEMKFESTKIEDSTVTGMLTMHGQSAEISFPATIAVFDGKVSLTSEFKVDRTKFGMNYTGQPNDPINAEVDIKIIVGASPVSPVTDPSAPTPVN